MPNLRNVSSILSNSRDNSSTLGSSCRQSKQAITISREHFYHIRVNSISLNIFRERDQYEGVSGKRMALIIEGTCFSIIQRAILAVASSSIGSELCNVDSDWQSIDKGGPNKINTELIASYSDVTLVDVEFWKRECEIKESA